MSPALSIKYHQWRARTIFARKKDMTAFRKYGTTLGVGVFVGIVLVAVVAAQSYPVRPVRVIVGLAPGGGTDTITRVMAQKLSEMLGQPFVIDNRPSAGGNVAGELVAKATPDGYTLLTTTPTHVVNPYLWRDARYDAIKDFAPVVLMVYTHYFLTVRTSVPATSVKELIALAKTQRLSYASTGIGSANHLSGELFKTMAGIDMVHVPYKGGGPAITDTLGGQVQLAFVSIPAALQFVKAGKLKALAVTSDKRSLAAPDIPTIAESVPDCIVNSWYGALAPAKTPPAIVAKLQAAFVNVLAQPEVKEKLFLQGAEAASSTSAEFDRRIRDELKQWEYVIREAKIKAE
jgi:tripartite-type tricarboxylate transporter receptor subunit TctC